MPSRLEFLRSLALPATMFALAPSRPATPRLAAALAIRRASSRPRSALDAARPSPWLYPPSLMDHMLHRIREVNGVPPDVRDGLVDFAVDGRTLGRVMPGVAARLCSRGPVFEMSATAAGGSSDGPTALTLGVAAGTTAEERTAAVASVMEGLRDGGYVTGWRDELYPVAERFGASPAFLIERAAAPVLGMMEYGVHVK